jgi:hypothetical protein
VYSFHSSISTNRKNRFISRKQKLFKTTKEQLTSKWNWWKKMLLFEFSVRDLNPPKIYIFNECKMCVHTQRAAKKNNSECSKTLPIGIVVVFVLGASGVKWNIQIFAWNASVQLFCPTRPYTLYFHPLNPMMIKSRNSVMYGRLLYALFVVKYLLLKL